MANTFSFDVSRGVDVMRGREVIAHFDGVDALDAAWAYAQGQRGGVYVRYWEL